MWRQFKLQVHGNSWSQIIGRRYHGRKRDLRCVKFWKFKRFSACTAAIHCIHIVVPFECKQEGPGMITAVIQVILDWH